FIEYHVGAKNGHGMPRPYGRRREAGLGDGHGHTAIAYIVRGLHGAFGGEGNEALDEAFFGCEIDRRRFAGHDAPDGLGIFGGREFAGEESMRLGAKLGRSMLRPYNG